MLPRRWTPSVFFWLVSAATLFGAGLRFARLLSLPPQAWVDEAWFALRARDIVATGQFPIFYKTFWGGVNPMLVYLTALAQWLVVPRLIVSSRTVSATFSVVCVPLLFACLSEFWRGELPAPRRRGWAALAAVLLASFFSTITLSRLGTEPAVALAAGLACVWQTRRATRTGAWASFLLAGLVAGWAQYISPHARFILPLLVLLGLHDLVRAPAGRRWALIGGFALATVAGALVAWPITAFFLREPDWFLGRARAVTVGAAQRGPLPFLLENARLIALSFSWVGDPSPRDNLAYRPLFDPLQSIGFYIGLAWALWRWRRSASARGLLVWLSLMLAPALLTDNAPSFSRMIMAAPPALALIVTGWGQAWAWLRPRLSPRWAVGLALGTVLVSAGWNVYDYFGRFAAEPNLAAAYTATTARLTQALVARSQTEAVFVERIGEAQEDVYAFDFLLPGTPVRRMDFRQCLPLTDGRATRTTYLVWSEHDAVTVPALRRAYPSAAVSVIPLEREALARELTLVEVPAATAAPAFDQPAAARFAPGLDLIGWELSPAVVKPGASIFLTLYWKSEAVVTGELVAFTHIGTGLADSRHIAGHDGQPCQGFYPAAQWQPGDVVPDRFAIILPLDAPPGQYPIAVGWYHYPALDRLPVLSAGHKLADNRVVIGTLTVAP